MRHRSEDSNKPTPAAEARLQNIWQIVAECFHFIENDDQARAKGLTQEEHQRRHALFAWAFFTGMEYAIAHPNRAVRLAKDKLNANDQEAKLVDAIAEVVAEHLFPKPKVDVNKVLAMKEGYSQTPADTQQVRPAFDGQGRLTWVQTEGEAPFPWEYELETWEGSSE